MEIWIVWTDWLNCKDSFGCWGSPTECEDFGPGRSSGKHISFMNKQVHIANIVMMRTVSGIVREEPLCTIPWFNKILSLQFQDGMNTLWTTNVVQKVVEDDIIEFRIDMVSYGADDDENWLVCFCMCLWNFLFSFYLGEISLSFGALFNLVLCRLWHSTVKEFQDIPITELHIEG